MAHYALRKDQGDVMPLYAVYIERTIVVEADCEEDALLAGLEHECDEASNEPDHVYVTDVKRKEDVPEPWWKSYPYCGDGEHTVLDLLTSANGSAVTSEKP